MFNSVMSPRRRRLQGDSGLVIVYAALLLVFLMVVAAIVIDLGNARQQRREAVAAADAGALAGAQGMNANPSMPTVCASPVNDVSCIAAYHTFQSSNIVPSASVMSSRSNSCTLDTTQSGETCYRYASGGTTVEVKRPYKLGSAAADNNLLHVKVCWNASTAFARVIGQNTIQVCGSATAKNTPPGPGSVTGTTPDCATEDNFADNTDTPQIYV